MAKRKFKKKARRIATFGIVSFIVVIIIGTALLSVVIQVVEKYREKSELEVKLVSLQDKEDELKKEVNKLEDPEYLARYAREKYFFSKDGELIIRIPEDNKD